MMAFETSIWMATIPTAVAGLLFLAALKKAREEKAKKALVPATIVAKRKL